MEIQSSVNEVRAKLEDKPRSAKLMAKLACLLADQRRCYESFQDNDGSTGEKSFNDKEENDPLYWARKAVNQAPQKPFGYSALAYTSPNHEERMLNLRKAIQLSQDDQELYAKAMVGMLFQLLDEPRREESKRVHNTATGKSNKIRRPLDANEQETYQRLCDAIDQFWSKHDQIPYSTMDVEFVTTREYRLGLLFRKLQPPATCRPLARAHLCRVLKYLPHDHEHWSMAQFWLATLDEGNKSPNLDRCPKEYVVGLYSTFAEKFDTLLVDKLSYQTPQLLRALLDETGCITTEPWSRIIDLGAGTGLSGLAFRDCAVRLEGVDLSPEMVAKARDRGCYDRLIVGDLLDIFDNEEGTSFQSKEKDPATLVIACDVFCYIGDLSEIFQRVHRATEPNSIFAFSNELLLQKAGEDAPQYLLHNCARFSHRQTYIEALARENGFAVVSMKHSVIRKNQGEDVHGLLTILRKQ